MNFYFNQFKTPEDALEYLFLKSESTSLKGTINISTIHRLVGGGEVSSARMVSKSSLSGRIYKVEWRDESVAIHFFDMICMPEITGRSYPDRTHYVLVELPTNK